MPLQKYTAAWNVNSAVKDLWTILSPDDKWLSESFFLVRENKNIAGISLPHLYYLAFQYLKHAGKLVLNIRQNTNLLATFYAKRGK